jgi:alkylhydroperoxidase/carboxymuconolactone decarboxylase family protein YurZ
MIALYNYGDDEKGGPMLPPALEKQFNDFYHAAYTDGELDSKTKVLIGMAVAMTTGCYP